MKYFLIFNPGSRNGQSKKLIARIRGMLSRRQADYDYGITESFQDAYLLSQKANLSGFDAVVAVGGDGTINKVLNGFFDNNGSRISKAKMGVIYTGTSPDFCKSYGIPHTDIERSIGVLLAGKSSDIQIGQIVLAAKIGGPELTTRYFSCCVNIGLGAAVARHANSGIRKLAGDRLGTFIALMKAFMNYRPLELTVTLDGKEERISKLCNLSVGKTFYVASGIKVKSNLSEGDGRFYSLIMRDIGWTKVISSLKCIYSGEGIINSDTIYLKYSPSIEINGNNSVEVEFDGDPQGFLPCRIEMAKDKLELINEKC